MNETELEQSILNFVGQAEYRPMKPRAIAKQLNVPDEHVSDVKRAIKRLVHHGQLQYGPNHLVMAPSRAISPRKTSSGRIVGVFQRTSKGFGFVRPRTADSESRGRTDIYIPAKRAATPRPATQCWCRLSSIVPGEPGPTRRNRRNHRARNASVRRHVFRIARGGLRAG